MGQASRLSIWDDPAQNAGSHQQSPLSLCGRFLRPAPAPDADPEVRETRNHGFARNTLQNS